jgi:hypothetical protein
MTRRSIWICVEAVVAVDSCKEEATVLDLIPKHGGMSMHIMIFISVFYDGAKCLISKTPVGSLGESNGPFILYNNFLYVRIYS